MIKFIPALFLATSAFAQTPGGAPAPSGGLGGMLGFLPMILIFVILYFLMIRPQQKRQKAHQALISAVKPGDEVVTSGGLYGTVAGVDDKTNTVYLKIANDVKIRIERVSIARVISNEPGNGTR